MQKNRFSVTGMTCSACSARIERGVSKIEGVENVNVNLLTNTLSVAFDEEKTQPALIIEAVESLGYGAALEQKRSKAKPTAATPSQANTEATRLKHQFFSSLAFTLPLFYLSMGDMLGWPVPHFFSSMENSMIFALTLLILATPVLFINRHYFQAGFKNLWHLSPNMDSLIAIGSAAAFFYGIYAVYQIAWGVTQGDVHRVHQFAMDLYFESAAMILTLITMGKYLESRAKGRTSEAIAKLMNLAPNSATVLRDGKEQEIPVDDVIAGDLLLVKAGESVPVDGRILEGAVTLNESAITGESLPIEKTVNDAVTAGTLALSGYFKMEALAVGENTTLAQIIRLVEEATSSKAPIAKLADKISGVFVPIVITISIISAIVWALLGESFSFSLTIAISVLVISCPCALGLATPTAIMVGTGRGAAAGILFKSAESLENLHDVNAIILDKTGTITQGKPTVTDILPENITPQELLTFAASLEKPSSHPLAAPILEAAAEAGLSLIDTAEYLMIPGQGISAMLGTKSCLAGNRKLMEANDVDLHAYPPQEDLWAQEGKTVLYFAADKTLLGAIALADQLKPTSPAAVAELRRMGMEVLMLTGDRQGTAESIGQKVGLDRVVGEVLPQDKEKEVRALQNAGKKVVMVGDGINDAPALVRADVGIAIGAGTDIAIESADVVLMKSDLADVVTAIRLSRAVIRNIRQNLFWAFLYNTIGIPLAAGLFYRRFGLLLDPMFAAGAMSLSSVSVVSNALRLRFFQAKQIISESIPKEDVAPSAASLPNQKKERKNMITIIHIDGMSCMHCVGAVTKVLKALDGVENVLVDLEQKRATVDYAEGVVTQAAMKEAIEEEGFTVTGME